MLKVLYLGIESKDHMWEYDFLTKELFPQGVDRDDYFTNANFTLNDIWNTNQKFDVLVYFCRDPKNYPWSYIPTYDEILYVAQRITPEVIIQLSDEFVNEDLQDHNRLGNYCKLFLRHYHHKNYFYTDNTVHMPLGYKNGFSIAGKEIKKIKDKQYNWSFFGTKKSDRRELVDNFSEIERGKYALRDESSTDIIPSDKLVDYFIDSVFIPCSRGWSTVDTMRLYEASICGAIPVVVVSDNERKIAFKYQQNPPWIFANSWENAVEICKNLLNDPEKLQSIQDELILWWKNRISQIQELLKQYLIQSSLDKLKNFPKVYCVSLEENFVRRILLSTQFSKYNIMDVNYLLSKKYPGNGHIIECENLHTEKDDNIDGVLRGADCAVSHIKNIKKWIEETDDECAFFCEDDLSLETVKYWNFTWEEFYNKLPKDWECIQLSIISDHFKVESLEIQDRMWNFWGATAYIITREYGKRIIDAYCKDDKYILNPLNEEPIHCYWNAAPLFGGDIENISIEACPIYHKLPLVENILFTGLGRVYNCPIFVENIENESTFCEGHKFGHIESFHSILNSWKLHRQNNLSLQFMD